VKLTWLAHAAGVHPSYISRLELGERTPPPPTDDFHCRLALALQLSNSEAEELREAARATAELQAGIDASEPATVDMILALKRQLRTLAPSQVRAIREILRMGEDR
jgi:transcriptional regulator with XRE-family HTH domain